MKEKEKKTSPLLTQTSLNFSPEEEEEEAKTPIFLQNFLSALQSVVVTLNLT